MHRTKELPAVIASVELVPDNYIAPLDLGRVFERAANVEVDIGCGDGSFLTVLAKQNPHRNFLGLERLLGRVRSACRKIAEQNLSNARVLRLESSYAIRYLLPPNSIAVFHLMFPDPWPKRRHQDRRLVTAEFLQSIHHALASYGLLMVATDRHDYFEKMQRLIQPALGFIALRRPDVAVPTSTFEKRFRDKRTEVYRLVLRKVSEVR